MGGSRVIILVRHGQSEANRDGLLVGHLDVALTSEGERQAQGLVGALGTVVKALSSPLERARRTGELASPESGIEIDPAFIEMNYGELEGQTLREVGAATWRTLQEDHEWRDQPDRHRGETARIGQQGPPPASGGKR